MSVSPAAAEAARRRTFAVISHPDAGKSTLTEALALHARVIQEAGHIHGKAGRKSTVSDWMDIEKARGISISSAALQFEYGGDVVKGDRSGDAHGTGAELVVGRLQVTRG